MNIPMTYEYIKEEFDCDDDEIEKALAAIHIKLVKDCHYDKDFELTIEVWENDSYIDAPVIAENICDPEVYLGRHYYEPCVCPRCLVRLFDSELINLLIRKRIKIRWNPDWQTEAAIDPACLHMTPKLCAEVR